MTGQHFRRVVVANKFHDHGRIQECHSIECLYLLVLVGDIWWDWWWGNISYFVLYEHRAIHLPPASSPIRDHRHKESCCICCGILLDLHPVSSALARFLIADLGLLAHVLIPLLLVSNCFIHLKIILLVLHHKRAIRDVTRHIQSNQRRAVDVASRTKTALTMTYLFALFLACYTPLFCCFVVMLVEGRISANLHVVLDVSVTVVYINSSLNPAFYCWRMYEIRRAIVKLLKIVFSRQ